MSIDIQIKNYDFQDIFEPPVDEAEYDDGLSYSSPLAKLGNMSETERLLIHGIFAYGDTLFNTRQLQRLLTEIDETQPRNDAEQRVLRRLREAAVEAIRHQGYLWFIGD